VTPSPALDEQCGLAAALQPKPTVRVPRAEKPEKKHTFPRKSFFGKDTDERPRIFGVLQGRVSPLRDFFRESCHVQLSRDAGEHHRRGQLHELNTSVQVAEIARVLRYRRF